LLTAYADTDAAIRAINSVKTDYYLLKPWDPPEERLYPWLTICSMTGSRRSAHLLRDSCGWFPLVPIASNQRLLGRNQVPYQWMDIEGR